MAKAKYSYRPKGTSTLIGVTIDYTPAGHVGGLLFPTVEVQIAGGQVVTFGAEDFGQHPTERTAGAQTRRVMAGTASRDYTLANHALDMIVPKEYIRDLQDAALKDAVKSRLQNLVLRNLLLALEAEQAALATDPRNYPAGHVAEPQADMKWTEPDSDPEADVKTARETIRDSIGRSPNVLALSHVAYLALREHPDLRQTGPVTIDALAAYFDIPTVAIGGARRLLPGLDAVPEEGQGPPRRAFVDVWGNAAVLAYVPTEIGGPDDPSYGYTYTMEGHPLMEEPYVDHELNSHILGVSYERAPEITAPLAGYLISNPA
jgi:hypothetical protein